MIYTPVLVVYRHSHTLFFLSLGESSFGGREKRSPPCRRRGGPGGMLGGGGVFLHQRASKLCVGLGVFLLLCAVYKAIPFLCSDCVVCSILNCSLPHTQVFSMVAPRTLTTTRKNGIRTHTHRVAFNSKHARTYRRPATTTKSINWLIAAILRQQRNQSREQNKSTISSTHTNSYVSEGPKTTPAAAILCFLKLARR